MSENKSIPLSKSEVLKLVDMIAAQEVIFRKDTTAGINLLKENAWIEITDLFNSTVATYPRKPEQLRLKWENLKKNARKRIAKIRENNVKAEEGIFRYIPPDEALDKVASLIGLTDEKYSVSYDTEAVDETLVEVFEDDEDMPHSEKDLPSTINEGASINNEEKPCRPMVKEVKTSVIHRNRAIARYYIAKMKNEKELFDLKKRKLELELFEKEKQLNLSCNSCVKIKNYSDKS